MQTLTDWFKGGYIPKGAITWQEEQGRQAFQNGTLIFHRNWGYVYNLFDGSSKVAGSSTWRRCRDHGSGRLQPGWSQLRHCGQRREQGHRRTS